MTLKELAELVGTSVSTVSKAFSGSREIGEEMRERIFRVAREQGCYDKYNKNPRQTPLIAVLAPELESEYYGKIVGALEKEITARGADTVLAMTRFDHEREAHQFSEMVYRFKADGVILIGNGEKISNPEKHPLVIIGGENRPARQDADFIEIGLRETVQEAIRLLKEAGHRSIGFLGEPLTVGKSEIFRKAMRQHGLSVHEKYIVTDEHRFEEGGYHAMQTLLSRGTPPTAVIAAYSYMTVGAIRCALDHGLRVPEDISFIGLDDLSVAPYLDIPLATVETEICSVCAEIVSLLLRKAENRHYRSRDQVKIKTEVSIRSSVSRR